MRAARAWLRQRLAALDARRPSLLASVCVVVMGGYVKPPRPGLASWGPGMDYNVQQDVAVKVVWERRAPILGQFSVCLGVHLRRAHLPWLRRGGRLARLVADQSELYGTEEGMGRAVREQPGLPDDLLNLHCDPLECAVAVGWDGALMEETELVARQDVDGSLAFP